MRKKFRWESWLKTKDKRRREGRTTQKATIEIERNFSKFAD